MQRHRRRRSGMTAGRAALIASVVFFVIFGVLFIGAQASEHVPAYVSVPLLLAIVGLWAFSEFTDG